MNFEQPQTEEPLMEDGESVESLRDHETMVLRNSIQAELIAHECPPDDNWDACIQRWAKEGPAARFDFVFDQMRKQNPNLGADWEKSKSQILDDIHGKLRALEQVDEAPEEMRRAA